MHEKEDLKVHARMLREAAVHVPDTKPPVPAKVLAKKPAQRKRFKR